MSETPPIDPLAQLWQSVCEPDTKQLTLDLKRLQKTHQWQNRIIILILCSTGLLLVFGAAALQSPTLWIATVLWVAFVSGAIWYQRVRCRAADALDLDTISLLKRMIKRARQGLVQARRLYIGVPLAATASAIVTRILVPNPASSGHALHPWLAVSFTIFSAIMLVVMVGAGLVMAYARRRQIQELTEKLRSFEESL